MPAEQAKLKRPEREDVVKCGCPQIERVERTCFYRCEECGAIWAPELQVPLPDKGQRSSWPL